MTTAAVTMVRDEADIIETTVRHMLTQVDVVIVADNRSVDGTREIVEQLPVHLLDDPEQWAREVEEHRPYADDGWAHLRRELSRAGIDDDTFDRVTSTLTL